MYFSSFSVYILILYSCLAPAPGGDFGSSFLDLKSSPLPLGGVLLTLINSWLRFFVCLGPLHQLAGGEVTWLDAIKVFKEKKKLLIKEVHKKKTWGAY
jgi:hypothetical protein